MKRINQPKQPTILLLSILFLTTAVHAQSLETAEALVKNLTCLIAWVMPFVIFILIAAGGIQFLSGTPEARNKGKKYIINAFLGVIIFFTFTYAVSLAIPGTDVQTCFNAVPVLQNQAPIAEARAGYSSDVREKKVEVAIGQQVFFNGEQSKDVDGSISEYVWDFGDGKYGSGKTTTHKYDSIGQYFVKLLVKDNQGTITPVPSGVNVIVSIPPMVSSEITSSDYQSVRTMKDNKIRYLVRNTGVNITFKGNGLFGTPCMKPTYYSYEWYINNTLFSTEKEATIPAKELLKGKWNLSVNATDCLNKTGQETTEIYVVDPLNVTIRDITLLDTGAGTYETNCSVSACNLSSCSPEGNRSAVDRYLGNKEYIYNRSNSPGGSMLYLVYDSSLQYEITDPDVEVLYPNKCANCDPNGFYQIIKSNNDYYVLIGEDDFIGGLEGVSGSTCKEICKAFNEDFIPLVSNILACGADTMSPPLRRGTTSQGYTEITTSGKNNTVIHYIFADDMSVFIKDLGWEYQSLGALSGTASLTIQSLCMTAKKQTFQAEKCVTNFSATVNGGIPPYNLTWVSSGDGVFDKYIIASEGGVYDLVTTPPLVPPLSKGLHDITLFASDALYQNSSDSRKDTVIPWCCAVGSPCTKYWPGREGPVVDTGNELSYSCDIYEVCRPEIWETAREAIECCKTNCSMNGCHKYCNDAYRGSLNLRKKDGTLSSDGMKKCAGIYLIQGFGPGRKFLGDYFWPEICAYGDSYCAVGCCPQDIGTCHCCYHAYTREVQALPVYPAQVSFSSRGWKSDIAMNKNTCVFADLPSYASMQVLNTGTCCDYANSLTTTLRILGYTKDEVYAMNGPGHCYISVKFPDMPLFNIADTTGNVEVPFTRTGLPGTSYPYYCSYSNCRNDAGTFKCPSTWGC